MMGLPVGTPQAPWAWYLLLLLIPAAIGLFWLQHRRSGSLIFGNTLALRQIPGDFVTSGWWVPAVLRLGVMVFIIGALARPQEANPTIIQGKGVDVVICLDMSGSMNAVDKSLEDFEKDQALEVEPKNRFEIARELLIEFVKNRAKNGDRVGLVIFGTHAYLMFPPTTDYRHAIREIRRLKLDDSRRTPGGRIEDCINDCTISGAKTTIGDALARAFLRLRKATGKDRSIILITDGDDNGSKIAPKEVASFIAKWGQQTDPDTKKSNRPMPVYTFLIGHDASQGSGEGRTWIPERSRSGRIVSYRPASGRFPTNPDLLAAVAQITSPPGRTAVTSYTSYVENEFRDNFKHLEKSVYERKIQNYPTELYMPWVLWALAFLFAEGFLRLTILRTYP
jgi:Ca-activated chloride channel family protein